MTQYVNSNSVLYNHKDKENKDLKERLEERRKIMRINNYSKFFAEVAKIMDTSIKAVKQLEGRYKIELTNHVYFYVFRGVAGGLFIHDHRGVSHIVGCYNFEDFKTLKDLYERLVIDYSESNTTSSKEPEEPEEPEETVKEVMEVKQELNARFGKEQYFDTDSVQPNKTIIENINHCPNQNTCCIVSPFIHCDYNYKSDSCIKAHKNFIHDCEQVHKQMKARSNPEWHHVNLETFHNIDIDMLDEKRKLVRDINQILKDGIRNLYKCENHISYEVLERYVIRKCDELIRNNRLKAFWFSYIARQLDEVRRNTIYLYTPYITAHRNRY